MKQKLKKLPKPKVKGRDLTIAKWFTVALACYLLFYGFCLVIYEKSGVWIIGIISEIVYPMGDMMLHPNPIWEVPIIVIFCLAFIIGDFFYD